MLCSCNRDISHECHTQTQMGYNSKQCSLNYPVAQSTYTYTYTYWGCERTNSNLFD